jgi:hypothetical protein
MSLQNQSNISQQSFRKGMNIDLLSTFIGEDTLIHARNAILFNHEGEFLTVQNEQSPRKVTDLPFPVIGATRLPDGKWCLFLTDDHDSEIGIWSEVDYSYTTLLSNKWLNFHRSALITAASRQSWDGTSQVYWSDGRRNWDRTLNLSKANTATPDSILLTKLVTPPTLNIKKGTAGVLPNGSYQAVIRYSVNGQPFGAFHSLTLPIGIFHDFGQSGSLDISIDNLDNDFTEFELCVLQTKDNTETLKSIGFFPVKTRRVTVSNFDKPEYLYVPLSELTVDNPVWTSSDLISSNNQHLFRVGTQTVPELNYTLQAFDIKIEYTVTRAPSNYYSFGDEVGYYRDEAYLPFIQWLHKTGVWSSPFPVSGRIAKPEETAPASWQDVYEAHITTCEDPVLIPNWRVNNTAGKMVPIQNPPDLICDTQLVGYGEMAYSESTDTYPNNPVYGKWANTPIRIPKFPDEEKAPRYSIIDNKPYINILGWRFTNIEHPKKPDGTPDTDWVGYRIIRPDRHEGNKSVLSRGLLTNVRSYIERQGSEDVEVMYTNYPVNDLSPDQYLSNKQTYYKNSREYDFEPPNKYFLDRFTYYSPHTSFRHESLGPELKIESEETADVDGEFVPVYQHPKHKLLSLFSFWLAAALGATEALLTTLGKNSYHSETDTEKDISLLGGVKNTQKFGKDYPINSVEDLIGLDIIGMTSDAIQALAFGKLVTSVKDILLVIASLGLKILTFTFWGIQYADKVIEVIWNFLGYTNYSLQYNCHASFKSSSPVPQGYKRRFVTNYQYLESGLQSVSGLLYNNFGGQSAVFIQTNAVLSSFRNMDNSRQTITGFGIGDDITRKTRSTGVAYYATSKINNPNQYGRIESNTRFILTGNNYFPIQPTEALQTYSTTTIHGGDCYINRFTYQTKHQFFTQNQCSPTAKDGEEFDYRLYRNIAHPRFWIDTFKYDFSELITKDVGSFAGTSRTVVAHHNLDNKGKDKTNAFRVDNAYFYTSNNGVLDFFAESDFNLSFRQKPKMDIYVYSEKFSTLSEIFRSDRLLLPEEFNYDTSLNQSAHQIYAQPQPVNYDPGVWDTQYKYNRNRLIYSLPAFQEQQYDHWQYFLGLNQYTFPLSEFGNLVSLQRLDSDRLLFLFDRAAPYITAGRSELQVSGQTVSIGDGGMFAQPPREVMHTDQYYGSCQSRFAVAATPYGPFYVSERQGRIFSFQEQLDDLTRQGIQMWSKQYLPIQLVKYFPDYIHRDNPVIGVGYNICVDISWDLVYISKRDFIPKEGVTYNAKEDKFTGRSGSIILLGDAEYFDDVSVTLSYSPPLKTFLSFHDWIPDLVLSTENHFVTSKGTGLYLHNSNPQSYCNYYGKQYPFEVGYALNNKLQVETLSSLEYYLECYRYKADGINKVHLLKENFDKLRIDNSEQTTGLLTLHPQTGNPYDDLKYPIPNNNGMDILFSKVENRYRVNQFWDIVKDRQSDRHILHHLPNGYTSILNPEAIDTKKPHHQRKAIRHYESKVYLMRENPADIQMILKLALSKESPSIR